VKGASRSRKAPNVSRTMTRLHRMPMSRVRDTLVRNDRARASSGRKKVFPMGI
jgi:hypothetical protein